MLGMANHGVLMNASGLMSAFLFGLRRPGPRLVGESDGPRALVLCSGEGVPVHYNLRGNEWVSSRATPRIREAMYEASLEFFTSSDPLIESKTNCLFRVKNG